MILLSDLLHRRLRTRAGEHMRRVHDFRCEWRAGKPVCTYLVLGGAGLLERLGLRGRQRADLAPCDTDVEIRGSQIILRNS